MREILFKAKRLDNGEWKEGYIYKTQDICLLFPLITNGSYDKDKAVIKFMNPCFEVDPRTICQYTGLTDKNGNKIWGNDIFKHYNKRDVLDYKSYEIGVVKWDETKCRYINYRVETNETFNLNLMCDYEVIGNIFDNAELLEG